MPGGRSADSLDDGIRTELTVREVTHFGDGVFGLRTINRRRGANPLGSFHLTASLTDRNYTNATGRQDPREFQTNGSTADDHDGIAGFQFVINLCAVLSVSIGLLNLFPIPLLDGGHLMFYAAEVARGRPLSERTQEMGFRIGLGLVLMLMVFATYNDILRMASS